MWVKYDNFARHHSHSNALQPLPWCWKRPKLGPNICSFRLSGFRRSHPPTLVPPATCVHSWPKKVTTSALWKRMFEVASGYVIQLCMYYHDLSWPINHVVYMIIHVYLYCQDLHQIAVFYTTMRMLIHSSFEIARGPMDINNNKGCLHPLMLWEEGILIFMILVWVPWLLHFFFESWMGEHPLVVYFWGFVVSFLTNRCMAKRCKTSIWIRRLHLGALGSSATQCPRNVQTRKTLWWTKTGCTDHIENKNLRCETSNVENMSLVPNLVGQMVVFLHSQLCF